MTYKYWVLTSIFTLIFGFRSHFLYAQPMCSGNENNNEKIPKISVEKRPAWFRYNPLDHTYVRFLEEMVTGKAMGVLVSARAAIHLIIQNLLPIPRTSKS